MYIFNVVHTSSFIKVNSQFVGVVVICVGEDFTMCHYSSVICKHIQIGSNITASNIISCLPKAHA